jgi:hypothetical protein
MAFDGWRMGQLVLIGCANGVSDMLLMAVFFLLFSRFYVYVSKHISLQQQAISTTFQWKTTTPQHLTCLVGYNYT